MKKHLFHPALLATLFTLVGVQLMRGQTAREMPEQEVKGRAEIRRLASSSSADDRHSAVLKLATSYMDYRLLWQLMNDAAPSVRLAAIGAMTWESCTAQADQPLSAELAQKMAAMLEKEVTPERIRAVFEHGSAKDHDSGLITAAAETLNYLYLHHPVPQSPAGYAAWQRRVLRPLFMAAAGGSDKSAPSEQRHACMMNLFRHFNDPALLAETLPVVLQKLDSPATPTGWLRGTLSVLWHHPLLGRDGPLHLMLFTQMAPRLEPLRRRILVATKEARYQEAVSLIFSSYSEDIRAAQKKLAATSAQQPETAQAAPASAPDAGSVATTEEAAVEKIPQQPALPPLSPEQRQQKHAELMRLAASTAVQDRISAAEEMVSGGIDTVLFRKLLHDPTHEVSAVAMDALVDACHEKPCLIPLEEARKMAALLEPKVTEERITTLHNGKDAQEVEHRVYMTCRAALALNQLYRQYALLPSTSSYGHWQEEVLRTLVIYLAGDYRDPLGKNDDLVLEVLRAITDPAALLHTTELLREYPNLDDITAMRQLYYVEALWTHPLLGEGRPMNLVLLQQLAPVWEPVRDHILRNTRDKDRPDPKAAGLLQRMDAAYGKARQQLALQPAVK